MSRPYHGLPARPFRQVARLYCRLRAGGPRYERAVWIAIGLFAAAQAAAAQDMRAYRGMAVSVSRVETHCFKNTVGANGVLVPKTEVEVRPEQDGLQVAEVLVEAGDTVVKGQNLVRLVSPPGMPPPDRQAGPISAKVKSPVAGVITRVSAVVGAYTSASAGDPMFRIVAKGDLEMKADLLADDLTRLKIGAAASIRIGAGSTLSSKLVAKDPTIDAASQLGSVRLSIDSDAHLTPGAFVRADIDAGTVCSLSVPVSAVLYGARGIVVQVVEADRVDTRRVEIGQLDKDLAEVREGLSEGAMVVTRAGSFLKEGDKIRPVLEGPKGER